MVDVFWSDAELRLYQWVIFFLIRSLSCKAPKCTSEGQHSGLYLFQLVDRGVAAAKVSNWKQWGEGVWLYLGRSISFLELHLSKLKILLFMPTGLFRYCREAWKSSHRTPYRATMSMGIWGMYLDIKVACYLQYISIHTLPVPMNPFTSKLRGFPSTTGQEHIRRQKRCALEVCSTWTVLTGCLCPRDLLGSGSDKEYVSARNSLLLFLPSTEDTWTLEFCLLIPFWLHQT